VSACPQCSAPIQAAPRPRKFCSTPCQIRAANARRATTRVGRITSRAVALDPKGRSPQRSVPLQTVDRATVTHIAPTVDRPVSDHQDVPSVASKPVKADAPLTHRNGIAHLGDRVRIWIDSPVLGSGERHLMVTVITKSTVHLYSVAALREITITRSEFEQCAENYGSNAKIVLGLLESNLRAYARSGLEHDKPSAHAIDALREMAR
jgi:hypothetical protein